MLTVGEMSVPTEKTDTALAVVEKRPHRPIGGCVGIFVKLFDWNRRLAKKKLFAKRLLSSGRAKQASKKFGEDDKLPKHRLIADENSGGFPITKRSGARENGSENKCGAGGPGLVARLMGLETMPASQKSELRDASWSGSVPGKGEKVNDQGMFARDDLNREKDGMKQEPRPQKLQRIGQLEKRPVAKLGAEAFQFRMILPRPRKHPKELASPVKSPRNPSGRNASRLIGAATKILELGLQATSRMKCALPYRSALHHASKDEVMLERTTNPVENSNCYVSPFAPLIVQSSCRNCGSSLETSAFGLYAEEQRSGFAASPSNDINPPSNDINPPSVWPARSMPKTSTLSLEQGGQKIFQYNEKNFDQQTKDAQFSSKHISDRKPLYECQMQPNRSTETRKAQNIEIRSPVFKQKDRRKYQRTLDWKGVPQESRIGKLQNPRVSLASNAMSLSNDDIDLKQSAGGYSQVRTPTRVDGFELKAGIVTYPARRRRTINSNRQSRSSGFMNSRVSDPRDANCNRMGGNQMCNCAAPSIKQLGVTGNELNDVFSFTVSSPMKRKSKIPPQVANIIGRNRCNCTSILEKSLVFDLNEKRNCLQRPLLQRGVLLPEKLEKISDQGKELRMGSAPLKKIATMNLQDLIAALPADRPLAQDNVTLRCKQRNRAQNDKITPMVLQEQTKKARALANCLHDGDYPSPGSVLEASFSSDSCLSSGLDDSLDLSDSTTSLNKGSTVELKELVGHICNKLQSLELANTRNEFSYAIDVILTAGTMSTTALPFSVGNICSSISLLLLEELDAIATIIWANICGSWLVDDAKLGHRLRQFGLDCVLEYLDLTYSRYWNCGPEAWKRLPLFENAEMLVQDIINQVRKWSDLAGATIDELIYKEMSCGTGNWTDFQTEQFESEAELDEDILVSLVNEIVTDLWDDGMSSCYQ